jgi:hypothetical protein
MSWTCNSDGGERHTEFWWENTLESSFMKIKKMRGGRNWNRIVSMTEFVINSIQVSGSILKELVS